MNRLVILSLTLLSFGLAFSQQAPKLVLPDLPSPAVSPLPPPLEPGPVIKAIDIVFTSGSTTLTREEILPALFSQAGEPYRDENVERDIRTLYASGKVENVDIQTVKTAGGVKLVIQIAAFTTVGEIRFQGNETLDSHRLLKELPLKVGGPMDFAGVYAAMHAIQGLYAQNGTPGIEVGYDLLPSSQPGKPIILFQIDESAGRMVSAVRLEGNKSVKTAELQSKIKSRTGAPLDSQQVIEDTRRLEQAYQDQGYVYVKVAYRRELVPDNQVAVVFEITEGGKYEVSAMDIQGVKVFDLDELLPAIRTEARFPYSGSDVRGDERMIQDYYGSRGYADARVETRLADAGPGKLKVTFSVFEGTQSFIRHIHISGNTKTKDHVIRQMLDFAPGDPLNTIQLESAQTHLELTNYFEVRGDANPLTVRPVSTEEDGKKDIEINVSEKPTSSINFQFGASTIDGATFYLDFVETNFSPEGPDFSGDGIEFKLNTLLKPETSTLNVELKTPDFLGGSLYLKLPEPTDEAWEKYEKAKEKREAAQKAKGTD